MTFLTQVVALLFLIALGVWALASVGILLRDERRARELDRHFLEAMAQARFPDDPL